VGRDRPGRQAGQGRGRAGQGGAGRGRADATEVAREVAREVAGYLRKARGGGFWARDRGFWARKGPGRGFKPGNYEEKSTGSEFPIRNVYGARAHTRAQVDAEARGSVHFSYRELAAGAPKAPETPTAGAPAGRARSPCRGSGRCLSGVNRLRNCNFSRALPMRHRKALPRGTL
jgi:hypothetical protein